jgi:hypothetical protein
MAHAQKRDFLFQQNGRVHLNRREASVQSTNGSQSVRIAGSNAGYTTFRSTVKSTVYPIHSPVSPSHPLPCITLCHHILTGVYLVCRDVLRAIGKTSYGIRVAFMGWDEVLATILFIYLYMRCNVYSSLIWHSEDRMPWYSVVITANKMHYFSNLFLQRRVFKFILIKKSSQIYFDKEEFSNLFW